MLSEPPADVVLSLFNGWIRENMFCGVVFDQFAEIETCSLVRYAARLLHGVSDDDNGEILA